MDPVDPDDQLPPQFVRVSRLADGTVVHPGASDLIAMASDGSAGLWSRIDGSFEFPRRDLQLWSRSTGKTTDAADPPQASGEGWYPSEVSDDLRFVTYEVVRRMETGRVQWSLRLWDRLTSTVTVIHPYIDDYYEPGVGTYIYTGLFVTDISADGRYVLYESNLESSKLVLWDRTDGSSVQISDSLPGFKRNGTRNARVSDDGRYVVLHGMWNEVDPEAPEWEKRQELARWDRETGLVTLIPTTLPEAWVSMNTTWGGWTHLSMMRADGTAVLVTGVDGDSNPTWGLLDTGTGQVEAIPLPDVPAGTAGQWYVTGMSPDGGSLALETSDWMTSTSALFTWTVGGAAPLPIAQTRDRVYRRLWLTNGGRQAMYWSPPLFDGVEATSGIFFWDADKIV